MATNYVQPGDILDLHAPLGGVTSGTPVLIGEIVVVPLTTAAADAHFNGAVKGVFDVVKMPAEEWTEGESIYFDSTANAFTGSPLGNVLAGVAVADASVGAVTGRVLLIPGIGIAASAT